MATSVESPGMKPAGNAGQGGAMGTQIVSLSKAFPHGIFPDGYHEKEADSGQTLGVGATFHFPTSDVAKELEFPLQAVADIVIEHMRNVPDEVMRSLPSDGASQHDHYVYGWAKREV
jgi:hypothetical protein